MFNLIRLQLATLYTQRLGFGVAGLSLVVLTVFLSYAGWLETTRDQVFAAWIELAAWIMVEISLLISAEKDRAQHFLALGKLPKYQYAGLSALIITVIPLIILWSAVIGMGCHSFWTGTLLVLAMTLFCIVLGQGILCNLMPRMIHLSETKRLSLIIVTAMPWIVPAWLFGVSASEHALSGKIGSCPSLLWMLLLLGMQIAVGNLFSDTRPNQKSKTSNDKEENPSGK